VNISGGSFSGRDAIRAGASSTINISGGTIGNGSSVFGLLAQTNSTINITGGTYDATFGDLYGSDNAIINIFGSGLQLSGGQVVGTLQSGESINASYQFAGGAQINLFDTAAVPEAFSGTLTGRGLLWLGILKRRHKAS
jgi:hypothetical protein